jgi:hypothetical protein
MSKASDQTRLEFQARLGGLARPDILSRSREYASFPKFNLIQANIVRSRTALILPISLIPELIPQVMVTRMHTITLPNMEEELKKLINIITVLLRVPQATTLAEMLL